MPVKYFALCVRYFDYSMLQWNRTDFQTIIEYNANVSFRIEALLYLRITNKKVMEIIKERLIIQNNCEGVIRNCE